MDVIHCPRCGSDSIETSTFSAEYMSKTTYDCEDCSWGFGNGSGIGTGSGDSGTHPRDASPDDQKTLGALSYSASKPGVWCSTCDTCARPDYCQCLEDGQTGFCKACANYSEYDQDEMWKVATYFGRYSRQEPWKCSVCGENNAELKVV